MQRQQLQSLQSNKLVQWGVMFLVGGVAVNLALMLGSMLYRYAGWAIGAGIILIVVGLIRGK
ncbi:hypothetical protein [Armatimonas sp.]|uniref:hypothetical protein n=1 Tax=Armatimonas sp. TaxID=1872638 RepID=UPI00286D69E7|nr:hypothetical protein [Armatimonas sp.]